MEGPRGRNWRPKFSIHIFITLCFAVCLIFNSEKLPLVDFKSRVSGILETEDAQHVGRFSKLTTAGLVMWPLCFIADRLIKMLGEGKIGTKWCEAAMARSSGVDASATFRARSHFVDVPHVRQQFHWDCGLACVLMVLRTVGIGHIDIHQLVDLCSTTSGGLLSLFLDQPTISSSGDFDCKPGTVSGGIRARQECRLDGINDDQHKKL